MSAWFCARTFVSVGRAQSDEAVPMIRPASPVVKRGPLQRGPPHGNGRWPVRPTPIHCPVRGAPWMGLVHRRGVTAPSRRAARLDYTGRALAMNSRLVDACAMMLIAVATGCSGTPVPTTPGITGLWDAVIVANNAEVPFRFEIAQNERHVRRLLLRGRSQGGLDVGKLRARHAHGSTTISSTRRSKRRSRATTPRHVSQQTRRTPVCRSFERNGLRPCRRQGAIPQVEGNWAMYRTADDGSKLDVSWRLYLRQSGPEVSGAILRTSGDTGTLVGHWKTAGW